MNNMIEIDLDSRFEYINEFDDSKINDRLHQYILDSIINVKQDIILNIKFNYQVQQYEIESIDNIFKSSFKEAFVNNEREINKSNSRDLILLILGFLFLIIYCYLENFNVFIFAEFFMVISWVAFWEVVESLLFKKRELVIKNKKYASLLDAKIKINY